MFVKIDKFIETDLPILINGWSKVKELYPKQKITNKKISDTIFWTFSEKEKRNENLNDTTNFKKRCVDFLDSKYKYYFLNPFDLKFKNLKNLINKINHTNSEKVCFIDGKDYFILIENHIFGLNTDFLEYTKIGPKKVENWLKVKNFKIFKDSDIFNIEDISNKKYLIPIFKTKNYEEQLVIGYIFE